MKRYFVLAIILIAITACEKLLPSAPEASETLAEPIEGLTNEQMKTHLAGDGSFGQIFSEAEGLGPTFVATSCEGCHVANGKGHPFTALTRFSFFDGSKYDPLIEL